MSKKKSKEEITQASQSTQTGDNAMGKKSDMPISPMSRSMVSAATLAKAGGKSLKFLARKPFLNDANRTKAKEESDQDIAETIFQGLSKLRGTALKLAQMLSLEADLFPEHLCKQLNRSHYKVPPLNKALVRAVVEREFNQRLEDVFASFDLNAFAAASLGQVHRAILPDGTAVAVKVQYPGIEDAIRSDIKLVKSLVGPIASKFTSKQYFDRAVDEVGIRLTEEADYLLEAAQTEEFRTRNLIADVVVPKTYPAYSGKTVLTVGYVEGLHVEEWLATHPGQELINRASQAMYDFHTSNMVANGMLHGDPNPGNYLFLSDGRVAVIDFGCSKRFTGESYAALKNMLGAIVTLDKKRIEKGYESLGFTITDEKSRQFFESHMYPFTKVYHRPHTYRVFDFKVETDFTHTISRQMVQIARAATLLDTFTTDTIFIDRTFYGIYRIFDQLGSEVRFSNEWLNKELNDEPGK